MKLWSGSAKFPLIAFAIASLGMPALAQTSTEPRIETEAALGCLLGMAPDGCQNVFANTQAAWRRTTYCSIEYPHRRLDNCYNGVLETVEYLGADAAGADVYAVNYQNAEMTYVVFPPAPDGKIAEFSIFNSPPDMVIGRRNYALVAVTSPTDDTQPVYIRPEQGT